MKKVFVSFAFSICLFSCGNHSSSEEPAPPDSSGKGATAGPGRAMTAPTTIFLPTLLLSKDDFNALRAQNAAHVLVFQFHYTAAATGMAAPDLVAYAMKLNHKKISDLFKVLVPFGTSGESMFGRETIYGDNQIDIKDVTDFIDAATGSHDGNGVYENILFTPRYDATNKHIFFELSLTGTAGGAAVAPRQTNPSPPATAS